MPESRILQVSQSTFNTVPGKVREWPKPDIELKSL